VEQMSVMCDVCGGKANSYGDLINDKQQATLSVMAILKSKNKDIQDVCEDCAEVLIQVAYAAAERRINRR
jgi:hypothetical protein